MDFAVAALILLFVMQTAQGQSAEITVNEWMIPTPNSAPHDIVADRNGIAWFTEINTNKIGRFDPKTELFTEYSIPTPSSGPHGLVIDESGNVWFTEIGASKIGKLDPQTGQIVEYSTPTTNSGPHTPILDNNTLWFTENAASKIGALDITTGAIREFSTPTPSSSPYGIIVDFEGNAWFAELGGHKIGKVDARTGQVTEYPTPTQNSGTRRIAIDSNGILWFTEYNVGKIGSFDPKTGQMTEYDTSSKSSGPYAIWVDIHDSVWFSMTGTYKVGKFDQNMQTIREYDLPTPRTIIRFIYADSHGNVWFPNNNNNKIGVIFADTQAELTIPSWIKNNAKWWSEGKIGDNDFVLGIKYLIEEDIMKIPTTGEGSSNSQQIPSWIKNNAKWWADGLISDGDFVKGIQYLISNGIMILSTMENSTLCQGTKLCMTGTVEKIVDGDTIYVKGEKIRLSLTNTPERNEAGYAEATQFTSMLCPVGSTVTVDQDDKQPYDVYGRMLGKVFCGSKMLNEELLLNHHAQILIQYCDTSEYADELWAKKFGCTQTVQENENKQTSPSKENSCDPSYPDVCIPPWPPDLDCGEIPYRNFKVLPPDPHRFDGDKDGIGCEK